MLHIVVGNFSTFAQTRVDNIRGAALQLQRERQWFKEVESKVQLDSLEEINHADQAPPRTVFTKYHKELMKEGEKSMKETATSCTVVGALVVTMMFAAAFTVPGGNNQDTGAPMFLKAKGFMIFIISDAISLFSSTTSVMIFLGILTSRYKEDDFLKSLPTKMTLGLFTLFLCIATMMITFSAALYIMLQGKSWVIIPTILLSSVPIASFVWMQFPFFVEIFVSTYGADVFVRENEYKSWWTILDS
ncbi:putative PGG domain-containing protein [Rosa chinensis]|uniref:Putative PGG domain-containing protein n=1 Tax=Rosa chinensis TaxID=74649 RepID=A0A2P6S338_ROSCH|nr:putative PGG domain-containing protein [Rosa chinensis]